MNAYENLYSNELFSVLKVFPVQVDKKIRKFHKIFENFKLIKFESRKTSCFFYPLPIVLPFRRFMAFIQSRKFSGRFLL